MTPSLHFRVNCRKGNKVNFSNYTEDEIKKWCLLRAVEWADLPVSISQPLAPIAFIFFRWDRVIAAIVVFDILWSFVRRFCVNVTIATIAPLVVFWTKWPSAIGSAICLLFLTHKPVLALAALAWPLLAAMFPLLAGFIGISGKFGVIELAFAKKVGFVPEDAGL